MADTPLIADDRSLARLMDQLRGETCLALDTEASSFHRYHERIGLVQLSDRTDTWLVDPLAMQDMAPLGRMLADERVEVVVHDADYDLRLLKRMYGYRVHHVFDTLIAAELLNEPELSLAALLKKYFGVVLDKRYQKADWCKRPLTPGMLEYAAMDTRHLIALRDRLAEQLHQRDRWSWAEEEFGLLTEVPFNEEAPTEPGFVRIKGAKALKPKELAVLRELFTWRDQVAARLDRAPFMVLGNAVMIDLAKEPPTGQGDLAKRKGIGDSTVKKNGAAILQAVERGLELPKDQWPRLERPKRYDRDPDYEDRLKRLKKTRDRLMEQWDLRPGVVCANQLLAEIARTRPSSLAELGAVEGLRQWQLRTFGKALLEAL